jgi:hypothetical protein
MVALGMLQAPLERDQTGASRRLSVASKCAAPCRV